jgi:DNA-binding FadR family transcriptional regulator
VATRQTGAEPAQGEVGTGLVLGDRAYDALLRPVRAGNAFEETLERLLTAIKLGIVAPGARLPPERDLAERLSVSRVTLREAIRALQQSGYVESRRGRYGGTVVVSIQVLDRAESEDPPLRAHHGLEPMAWPRARCKTNCE